MPDEVTPIRQQYLEIKRQYPNAILLFRLGDFYETFDEDAEITARELDIVLTSRPIGKGQRAPLAGIPYHAIENYLARLIQKGYHVAICEQVGDQPSKGIFPRKVVRVVTPGTIIEPGLLPEASNNYLSSIVMADEGAGFAYVDITTGEFAVTELDTGSDLAQLGAELSRLRPAESIYPENQTLADSIPSHLTPWPSWHFEPGRCKEIILSHFGTTTLEGFGLQAMPLAIRAAGGILQYLKETEPAALALLSTLHVYNLNSYMTLDPATRRNLELTETLRGESKGSLLGVLDQAVTPMGKRLIRHWVNQPLLDITQIHKRQDGVEFFLKQSLVRAELRSALKPLADMERLANRISSEHAQPRDLVSLRDTLNRIPPVLEIFKNNTDV